MAAGPKCTITVQSVTKVSNGFGGYADTWATSTTLTGTLLQMKSSERFSNDAVRSKSTHYFICDYPSTTITTKDRVSYNSEYYDITYVNNLSERSITLILDLAKVK